MKERLDKLIVEQKIIETREKAKAYIIGGHITVNGETIIKPGSSVSRSAKIKVHLPNKGFVSRGGLKLEGAIKDFRIDVSDTYCLDIGASTGGFTDCLVKKGARHVIALDVGKNQIDYRLRIDPRVKVIEKFNARFIDQLEVKDHLDIVTVDVSFISVKLILKSLISIVGEKTKIIVLIKPQFELDKPYRGFHGVVTDSNIHRQILQNLNSYFFREGYTVDDYTFSRLKGPKGNIEYFVYIRKMDTVSAVQDKSWPDIIDRLIERSYGFF